jgi:hypothetical protein
MAEYAPVNLSRKNTDSLAIWCSDFRFQEPFKRVAESGYGINNPDVIVYPAPSKSIADGTLVPAIEKLHSLHDFNEVDIFDHIDCGGFGGLEAFNGSEDAEADEHFRMLKIAKEVIRQTLPHLQVRAHLLGTHHELVTPIHNHDVIPTQEND